MSMTGYFDKNIKPAARKLDELRGIKTIEVKEVHSELPIRVTKYIRAINPFGELVYVTDLQMRKAEELGLSMRKA